MEYKLVRSKRKTIAICINKDATVTVRSPLKASKNMIDCFVNEKKDWITKKSDEIKKYYTKRQNYQIKKGSTLQLLGRNYPVLLSSKVYFDWISFFITDSPFETLKPKIVEIYKSIALKVISERIEYFSKLTGFIPARVRIGSANTYWGCCSGKNNINFSWKLIMAEPKVIDYVIIHELCHTAEHNHSKKFWNLVENILPDYKERQIKLKEFEKKLLSQNWSL